MSGGADRDPLAGLAGFGKPTLGPTEVCEVAGVDREVGDRLWRALGFPDVPEGTLAYTEEDARALSLAAQGLERLEGPERERAVELLIQEARIVSAHLAALAEVEVDALVEVRALGLRETIFDEVVERGIEGSELAWLIVYALRRQLLAVLDRRFSGGEAAGRRDEIAVAFVDLSGFTELSEGLGLAGVGELLTRFESLAFDVVAEAGGRVVKLIGDEVMFVCPQAREGALASLDIVERTGEDGIPPARAGLAAGPVLRQGGDYFGPAVNLANRINRVAEPGSLVVDEAAAGELGRNGLAAEPLGARELKGLGAVELFRVRRG